MSQFALVSIKHAVDNEHRRRLKKPISRDEFEYASMLLTSASAGHVERSAVNLGEYILMRLLSYGATTRPQIEEIAQAFYELDVEGSGTLSFELVCGRQGGEGNGGEAVYSPLTDRGARTPGQLNESATREGVLNPLTVDP